MQALWLIASAVRSIPACAVGIISYNCGISMLRSALRR